VRAADIDHQDVVSIGDARAQAFPFASHRAILLGLRDDGHRAAVDGPLNFEREVSLYVSDKATIGPVQGATIVKHSGDRPPE
jgi:hypothetical protein